jgi:hypothetical protein
MYTSEGGLLVEKILYLFGHGILKVFWHGKFTLRGAKLSFLWSIDKSGRRKRLILFRHAFNYIGGKSKVRCSHG